MFSFPKKFTYFPIAFSTVGWEFSQLHGARIVWFHFYIGIRAVAPLSKAFSGKDARESWSKQDSAYIPPYLVAKVSSAEPFFSAYGSFPISKKEGSLSKNQLALQ